MELMGKQAGTCFLEGGGLGVNGAERGLKGIQERESCVCCRYERVAGCEVRLEGRVE